ncbi:cation-transporting P-type ATPase [Spinellus fusiger]|nr:cation-transporting P-type ATPase [Spinellus fusiger]
MALGVEPKERHLMQRPPRNPKTGVLTKVTWTIVFCQAIVMATLTIANYVLALHHFHYTIPDARSLAFTTITTLQLTHCFMSRSIHQSVFKTGIHENRWILGAFFLSFGCMLMGIYAPGVSTWLELTAVNGMSWVMILICVIVFMTFVELEKLIVRQLGCVL